MKRTRLIMVTVTTEEEALHHFADLESVIHEIVDVYRESGDVGLIVESDSEHHLDQERELLEAIDEAIGEDDDDEGGGDDTRC